MGFWLLAYGFDWVSCASEDRQTWSSYSVPGWPVAGNYHNIMAKIYSLFLSLTSRVFTALVAGQQLE